MKGKRYVSIFVAVSFFFTWIVPVSIAAEAGDKFIKIFQEEIRPPDDLLPKNVRVADGFKPGTTADVGKVKKLKGRVLVVHADSSEAYMLKKGRDVHTGDMLITGEESTIQVKLKDKSLISLASYSKIVIDSSVYDPKKKTRSSFMSMLFGKARFVVSKLVHGRADDFKIKTPTAVCGVRGSDFALAIAPADNLSLYKPSWLSRLNFVGKAHAQTAGSLMATTVVTGEGTSVNFTGDVGQTQVVGSLQTSSATAGMPASAPTVVSAAAAAVALEAAGGAIGGMSTGAAVGLGVLAAGAIGAGAYYGYDAYEEQQEEEDEDEGGNGGNGGTDTVRVTLVWDNCNDLDLFITDPCGNEISFQSPPVACGNGATPVFSGDVNKGGDCVAAPTEYIEWQTAPSGSYTVMVDFHLGTEPSDYTVTTIVNGVTTPHTGYIELGRQTVTTFVKQ